MDTFIIELANLSHRSHCLADSFKAVDVVALEARIDEVVQRYERSWSGSWIGYHADCYLEGFRPRGPGDSFDAHFGPRSRYSSSSTRGTWVQVDGHELRESITAQAGAGPGNPLQAAAAHVDREFQTIKQEIATILDVLLAEHADSALREIREEVSSLSSGNSAEEILSVMRPKQVATRDMEAMQGGLRTPAHRWVQALRISWSMRRPQAEALGDFASRAASYLRRKLQLHQTGNLDRVREVLRTPAPSGSGSFTAGNNLFVTQNVMPGASVGGMAVVAETINGTTARPEITPASFEREVTEILRMLVEQQEQLDDELRDAKKVFKKLAAISLDEEDLRSVVLETLDDKDKTALARIKNSTSTIAHGLVASSIFKFLEALLS